MWSCNGRLPGSQARGVKLVVNAEPMDVADGSSLADLVACLGLEVRKVAVERNLQIVLRSAYATTQLQVDDRIEIVHFIGGG